MIDEPRKLKNVVAIIPARGGSKRIPRKNIREFCGKPIIAYSIKAAIDAAVFDRIIVSTDDHEIADVSVKYGAEVPFFRSKKNSDDVATTFDVLQEVLTTLATEQSIIPAYGCCLYPTAPFVEAEHLRLGLKTLADHEDATSVLPVVQFGFPIQRAFKIVNGRVHYVDHESALARSQDLPKTYHDAGQYYIFRVSNIFKSQKLIDDSSVGVVTKELYCQDIDNEDDWELAELKYRRIINGRGEV